MLRRTAQVAATALLAVVIGRRKESQTGPRKASRVGGCDERATGLTVFILESAALP